MISVAICDDDKNDVEKIKAELISYSKKKGVNFSVSAFLKPELLEFELSEGRISDIYILDVSMPGKNGFMLADEIRKHTQTAVIMFLTSHDDLAINGYKSKALRYIIKMNLSTDIEEALDSAVKEISNADYNTLTIQKYSDIWRIPYKDIISVARISRQLLITTNSFGELYDNRGLTQLYNTLNDSRFIFIDRSCFINVDYISQIVGYSLKLKNGQILSISRRAIQVVKQLMLDRWGLDN